MRSETAWGRSWRATVVSVIAAHVLAVGVNFDAALFGHSPGVAGTVVTVVYAIVWLVLGWAAGRRGGPGVAARVAVWWVIATGLMVAAYYLMVTFELSVMEGGLLAPVVLVLLAAPFYGASGGVRGDGAFTAAVISAVVLGALSTGAAVIGGWRTRSRRRNPS